MRASSREKASRSERPVTAGTRSITLLDTSAASTNLGDQIIMDAVRTELAELCPDDFVHSVATHEWMGRKSRSLLDRSGVTIAGGTNLLSSHMWLRPLWKLSPLDVLTRREIVLMGVGWYQVQRRPDAYTRFLLKRALSREALHSVRDGYSLRMLAAAGIPNAVNTGCPTLWRLTPDHCARIPRAKGARVLTTLNTYMPRPDLDRRLLQTLRLHYGHVYFWIQTESDFAYARELDPDLDFLSPSLSALDDFLRDEPDLDYVGNRLHAGIRALQHQRRAIIVEIDNRAREMGADFELPIVKRDDFEALSALIEGSLEIRIRRPQEAIERWKRELRQHRSFPID